MCRNRKKTIEILFQRRVEIGGLIANSLLIRLHDAHRNFDEGAQGIGGRSSWWPSTDRCLINFKKQLHAC